ncbi:unnamed protein product [Linum tenue]|uniref:RNase H type-1 domain-containing protein n=2 Tax=Linum tenue TaxID=586396 RepID=A0AAV0MBK9_9ROSI|nr:unnamed protein product [Linum tenue]
MTAITILTSPDQTEHRYHNLIQQFKRLLQHNWEIRISHIFREGNKVVDFLANKGHAARIGFHDFDITDPGLSFRLLYDSLGIAQTRLI